MGGRRRWTYDRPPPHVMAASVSFFRGCVMPRFPITEARARFCYHPCVVHTVMSENRAAQLIQEAVWKEGKRPGLPRLRDDGIGPKTKVLPEIVLPMIDAGVPLAEIAAQLGVSPQTISDRARLWRTSRRNNTA